MKRRQYFLFSSIQETKKAVDELLLARVCIDNIHILAKEGSDLGDLPEAGILQKNDIMHSVIIGLGVGGLIGIFGGLIAHNTLDLELGGALLIISLATALIGAWASAMIGISIPNQHLKRFANAIENGQILLMVDVKKERVEEIEALILSHHATVKYKGIEPTIPGFP